VLDESARGQGEGIALAERRALQELQVGLLGPLPTRDLLKVVDVPADYLPERCLFGLPVFRELHWTLQCNLAVPGPTYRGRPVCEGSALLMNQGLAPAPPHDGGIPGDAVCLLAGFDRRQDGRLTGTTVGNTNGGDKPREVELVPFMSPSQTKKATGYAGMLRQ